MGDSVIPNPAITGMQRRNMVDDYVSGAQSGRPTGSFAQNVSGVKPSGSFAQDLAHMQQPGQGAQPQPGQVHPGVLQTIMQGISGLFGLPPQQPAAPAPAPAMADGGVVPQEMPMAMPMPMMKGPPPGSMPAMAVGGSVGEYMPRTERGDPTAFVGAIRGAKQHNFEEAAKVAASDAVPTFAQQPEKELHDAVHDFGTHLENGALNDAGMPAGSQGMPGPAAAPAAGPQGAAGAPAVQPGAATGGEAPTPGDQAAVSAVAQAAADPNAKAGVPQQSQQESAKPHSLTHDWWDESNAKMMRAVQAATRAGKDPKAAMESMTAVRNGFFQANIMKNLSAANAAILAGDNDAAAKAMKNVYYYFPDGKELDVKRGPNGEVMYQDPIHPYIDAQGNPTDVAKFHDQENKPNMVPVTPEHLSMLAQGAMDPLKVGDIIASRRAAGAKAALEAAEAKAKVLTAEGERMRGHGIELGGEARIGEMASTNVLKLSQAQWYQARQATSNYALQRLKLQLQQQKIDPQILNGAKMAASSVDEQFMGRRTTAPLTDPSGNPSLSPAAGKDVHDPSTIPKELQGATPLDIGSAKELASELFAANPKGVTPQEAGALALRAFVSKGKTHDNPTKKGQKDPDVLAHSEEGKIYFWNPATRQYTPYAIDRQAAASVQNGGMTEHDLAMMASSGGESGAAPGGAIPNPVDQATTDAEQ